ncbi:MAG: 30S ribosomal protein S5 [Candidatus Diapherotrites archaeon]
MEKEKELREWIPKTSLGRKVINGEIKSLEEILSSNVPILEPEIVDYLEPMEEKTIDVQKTARVVRAGRKFSFRVSVLVGNRNGIVGIGTAKDKERWPATRKAARNAKLNLVLVKRGCGSWECPCNTPHSVPFKVEGKNASVRVTLIPAPKGLGLVAGDHIKDVLELAGIKDVWTKTRGATATTLNFARATIDALAATSRVRVSNEMEKKLELER